MPSDRFQDLDPSRLDRNYRTLLVFGATLGYALLAGGLWWGLRVVVTPLAAVPVVGAAWYFGVRGSVPLACLFAAGHGMFFVALEGELGPLLREGLLGGLVLVTTGVVFSSLRNKALWLASRRRESGQRYELAARGAGDGLWDWNLETEEVYYAPPVARLFGVAPEQLSTSPDEWLKRVHPEDLPELRRRLDAHMAGREDRFECEHRLRHQDGSWRWALGTAVATADGHGSPKRLTGWLTDIALRKLGEDQLRLHAFHDPLTGLPNRVLFMDRLANAIARCRRRPERQFALLLLDLDRFKVINDSLGHSAGDELLDVVARRLAACVRPGDTVGRLGGDEFMLLLEDLARTSDAEMVVERIHHALAAPLPLDGHDVVSSASVGIVFGDQRTTSPHELLRNADIAMYEAKSLGKGRHVLFDGHMHLKAVERMTLENALRDAVERDQMRVYYQPIVSLSTGHIVGFEALARWQHPDLGLVSPTQFIPLAEETGIILQIGQWILLAACAQTREWQMRFERTPPLRVSVNLSVRQMLGMDILERVRGALQTTRLPPSSLAMEVTESVIMDDRGHGPKLLEDIRRLGVKVYMDDFGTGYSSLGYLQRFRVDALKIDGSFVRDVEHNKDSLNIVRSITTLAKSLGLKVVAEGVEKTGQLNNLRALGCDEAQGYLFSRPGPAEEMEEVLRRDPRW